MAHVQVAERHDPKLDATYDSYDFPIIAPAPQNGHPGYTNEMQEAQVNQLRMMLEQDGYKDRLDTLTLVRDNTYFYGRLRGLTSGIAKIFASTQIRCELGQKDVCDPIRP